MSLQAGGPPGCCSCLSPLLQHHLPGAASSLAGFAGPESKAFSLPAGPQNASPRAAAIEITPAQAPPRSEVQETPAGRRHLPRAPPREVPRARAARLGGEGPRRPLCQRAHVAAAGASSPAPSAGPVGGCRRAMTSPQVGAPADLSIPAEEPRPRSPVPSLLPAPAGISLLCGAPVSQGGGCRRVTRHAAWGGEAAAEPGAGGWRGPAPAPHPSGSRASRPAPPSPAGAAAAPPRARGWHPGRRPRPGPQPPAARTHAGPQPPARGRPAPTWRRSRRSARSPAAAAAGARPSPPLLGHGRAAGGSARPGRTRAPRRPPAAAASAPSRAAQPARRFRIPAARPGPAAAALLAAAAERRRGARAHGALWPARPAGGPRGAGGRAGGRPPPAPGPTPQPALAGPAQGPQGAVCGPPPTLSLCRGPTCPGKVPAATVGLGAVPGYSPLRRWTPTVPRGSGPGPAGKQGMLAGRGACASRGPPPWLRRRGRRLTSPSAVGAQATEGPHSAPSGDRRGRARGGEKGALDKAF